MTIRIEGLKELRRDLKALASGAPKELRSGLVDAGQDVASEARSRAPRRSGRLAGSIRSEASGSGAVVGSPLVYAPVHEFGGRVGRQRATRIRESAFARGALEDKADSVAQKVEDEVERLARRHGFR